MLRTIEIGLNGSLRRLAEEVGSFRRVISCEHCDLRPKNPQLCSFLGFFGLPFPVEESYM
jgi:hypothetical protein